MFPYTAEVYFSLIARYNADLWPLHAAVALLAAGVLASVFRPFPGAGRAAALVLALAWGWIGIGFHWERFAALNFSAPVFAAAFVAQALLLVWTAVVRGGLHLRFGGDFAERAGLALAIFGLAVYPLLDGLAGPGWEAARLAGLAPGPTGAFTLGLLLLSAGRVPLHLAAIPALWLIVTGIAGWVLGIPLDVLAALAGIGALPFVIRKNRRTTAA